MPMMRRGPLASYNAEWVLRQASASETSGSIEFHIEQPLTLYLRNGRVCDAAEGVAEHVAEDTGPPPPDETTARARVLDFVTKAMRATDGWYYLDPIGHHVVVTSWDWDAASLILDARIRRRASANRSAPARPAPAAETGPVPDSAEATPPVLAPVPSEPPVAAPAAAADRRVGLVVPDGEQWITVSAEAWRLTCALAQARSSVELLNSLGWAAPRLDAALTELAAAGVLDVTDLSPAPAAEAAPAEVTAVAPDLASTREAPHAPPAPATAPTPIQAGRPKPTADRRSALRRLISNLKPA